MRLRVKLFLVVSSASAIAFAVSCGSFSGDNNGTGRGDTDSGASGEGGAADGQSASPVEGGSSTQDAAGGGEGGGGGDAGVDAAPSCDTFVCDDAGIPIPGAPCPSDTPYPVYEHTANCFPANLGNCEYCYSSSATAGTGDCTGFSDAPVPRFSVYSQAFPGLLELDRCGSSVSNHSLQLAGNCTVGATGATHREGVLGYVVPGKSCGNKDLTEMMPISTKYYAYNDAGTQYSKTGVVYWALPPP
jgi:hypothetical protein